MKLFVVFALCVAAASAFALPPTVTGADAAEIQQIIEAIYHPSTDPATAAALEQMLLDILGISKPVTIEENETSPVDVGPAIVDESIIVEPGHDEEQVPIDVGPAIIDESIVSEPANYRPPLVQVIVNVNTNAPGNAVVVEQPEQTVVDDVVVVEQPEVDDVVVVDQPEVDDVVVVDQPEVDDVVVVDQPEVDDVVVVDQPEVDDVVVVDQPEIPEDIIVAPVIVPEEPVEVPTPVIVSPIETIPAINIPGILN